MVIPKHCDLSATIAFHAGGTQRAILPRRLRGRGTMRSTVEGAEADDGRRNDPAYLRPTPRSPQPPRTTGPTPAAPDTHQCRPALKRLPHPCAPRPASESAPELHVPGGSRSGSTAREKSPSPRLAGPVAVPPANAPSWWQSVAAPRPPPAGAPHANAAPPPAGAPAWHRRPWPVPSDAPGTELPPHAPVPDRPPAPRAAPRRTTPSASGRSPHAGQAAAADR